MNEDGFTVENVHPDLTETQRAEALERIAQVFREVCDGGTN